MPVFKCDTCDKEFLRETHFQQHLHRKTPCSRRIEAPAVFACARCDKPFRHDSSLSRHRLVCKGRKITVQSLQSEVEQCKQEAAAKEQELRLQIIELEEKIASAEEADPVVENNSLFVQAIGFTLLADSWRPCVYLLIPGPLLMLEQPFSGGVVIKFGSSDNPPQRYAQHARDFGGYRLLDSIVTNNPRRIESQLKTWLKSNKTMLRGKTTKKRTVDTELFAVCSQDEYETVAKVAKDLADRYSAEVEAASAANIVNITKDNQEELRQLRQQLAAIQTVSAK